MQKGHGISFGDLDNDGDQDIYEDMGGAVSGDLAHIGPKFNDAELLDEHLLECSLQQDQALLHHAEAIDLDGYFRRIADERDSRNICGLPPTLTTLEAIRPRAGKLLDYDRYVHPQGYESVSFASMAFYK